MIRAAVLVVSSSRAAGDATPDTTGALIVEALGEIGVEAGPPSVVTDDRGEIAGRIRELASEADLIVTTGGTGFTPDDLTPEATRDVIDREAPGVAEAMRLASRDATPNWWLSRGVAGTVGSTLVVNFPGSPKAVGDCLGAIAEGLPHAIGHLRGSHAHGDDD